MPTGIVMDFDGVIVDSEPLHYAAFCEVLAPEEVVVSWEAYAADYIGFDDRDALRTFFRRAGRDLDESRMRELIRLKAEAFERKVHEGEVHPCPGAIELIRAVHEHAMPLALCSGALRRDIDPILARLGLDGAFEVMVTADDVEVSKPDPESYRRAWSGLRARHPGVCGEPETGVAIEDTPTGIRSAKGSGLRVLAVRTPYVDPADLSADWTVDTLEGLTPADLERL